MSTEKITNAFALDYVERRRTFFPFVTPNILAGYLAMVIPLALITKKKGWPIILMSIAILLTRSLGALLSLFPALFIYFYLRNKSKRKILILLLLGLAVIGVIFVIRTLAHKEHLQPLFSAIARLGYWEDSIAIIKARPLAGIGIGNFNLIWSRYAHNSYLQIWAEMGIFGIISILWLITAIFKTALKNLKDAVRTKEIAGITAAAAVFLIHNFVDFSFFLPEVSLIWWLICGLLLAA
jgi:O-antigen ligase